MIQPCACRVRAMRATPRLGWGRPGFPEHRLLPARNRRHRGIPVPPARGDERRDGRQRAEVLDLEVVGVDANAKALLQLKEQLHHAERVEPTGLQEIRLGRWYLDPEMLDEEGLELGIEVGRCRGAHRALTVSGARSSFTLRRSIFPLPVFGSSSNGHHRVGSMYGGKTPASASRNVTGVT